MWGSSYVEMTCGAPGCGVTFCVSQGFYDKCKGDSSRTFYCPNGHARHFAESETDKLRRERDRLAQKVSMLEDMNNNKNERIDDLKKSNAATRGVVTRIKNRIGNGVCPCCNRTFTNLAHHMKGQHPDYKNKEAA